MSLCMFLVDLVTLTNRTRDPLDGKQDHMSYQPRWRQKQTVPKKLGQCLTILVNCSHISTKFKWLFKIVIFQ